MLSKFALAAGAALLLTTAFFPATAYAQGKSIEQVCLERCNLRRPGETGRRADGCRTACAARVKEKREQKKQR
jgi:hypothetical protein